MKTAFIGTGVMGSPMAQNLLKAGHTVTVYNRTVAKTAEAVAAGASAADTIAQAVKHAEVIMTMVGLPQDVNEVYFGEDGILNHAKPGALLIDMTTTDPEISKRIFEEAKARGLEALDAPVSGGDVGAKAGTLSIMVGGNEDSFIKAMPIFEAMGSNILYEGRAGAGQHTKMANQIAIAGALSGVAEAVAYGRAKGLDLETMLRSIGAGAAGSWQMDNLGPKMVVGDFAPGFFIKHIVKDLNIADKEAIASGLSLGVLEEALANLTALEAQGDGQLGTQAIIRHYEKS